MTHTDPTAAKLFSEILRVPEDNDLRLVYADCLDELGDDPMRAELIRVQVELSRVGKTPAYDERQHWLAVRVNALITANRSRWLRVRCGKCRGGKAVGGGSLYPCRHCEGGDAGGLTWEFSNGPPDDRIGTVFMAPPTVIWDRGFPHRVEVPRLTDCVSDAGQDHRRAWKRIFTPTDWLRTVVAHHQTVVEVVPLDREPEAWPGGSFAWNQDDSRAPDDLPLAVFRHLPATTARTRESAISALGRAVVKWARKHIEEDTSGKR